MTRDELYEDLIEKLGIEWADLATRTLPKEGVDYIYDDEKQAIVYSMVFTPELFAIKVKIDI